MRNSIGFHWTSKPILTSNELSVYLRVTLAGGFVLPEMSENELFRRSLD